MPCLPNTGEDAPQVAYCNVPTLMARGSPWDCVILPSAFVRNIVFHRSHTLSRRTQASLHKAFTPFLACCLHLAFRSHVCRHEGGPAYVSCMPPHFLYVSALLNLDIATSMYMPSCDRVECSRNVRRLSVFMPETCSIHQALEGC